MTICAKIRLHWRFWGCASSQGISENGRLALAICFCSQNLFLNPKAVSSLLLGPTYPTGQPIATINLAFNPGWYPQWQFLKCCLGAIVQVALLWNDLAKATIDTFNLWAWSCVGSYIEHLGTKILLYTISTILWTCRTMSIAATNHRSGIQLLMKAILNPYNSPCKHWISLWGFVP